MLKVIPSGVSDSLYLIFDDGSSIQLTKTELSEIIKVAKDVKLC